MDLGVWMSRAVLEHKRQDDVAVQVWNLRRLPDGWADVPAQRRLFIAVASHWRGFFRLSPMILDNPADSACPYTLAFDPRSWTTIFPQRAPPPDRHIGYTLDLPTIEIGPRKETKSENETQELIALLEREEERE